MQVTKHIDLLKVLDGIVDLDALDNAGIVEQEVVINIVDYHRSEPATRDDPGCPEEWEQVPAENYGHVVMSRLSSKRYANSLVQRNVILDTKVSEAINAAVDALEITSDEFL